MTTIDRRLAPTTLAPPLWRRRSRLQRAASAVLPLLRRAGFSLALLVVLFALVAAVSPSLLSSFDPYATAPAAKLSAPSLGHWFGTDELGRDLYTRVVYGASLSVLAAFLAVGIALVGGLGLGILSGFAGGRIDAVLMRFIDVLLALPGLLLALAIVTAIGFGTVPLACRRLFTASRITAMLLSPPARTSNPVASSKQTSARRLARNFLCATTRACGRSR